MTKEFKNFLLDLHNKVRSKAANGKIAKNLGTATRMATIQWDDNLAMMAQNNAKKCTMHHSECANTPEFKEVGQNVGFEAMWGEYLDDKEVARKVMNAWVSEFHKVTPQIIKSNPDHDG